MAAYQESTENQAQRGSGPTCLCLSLGISPPSWVHYQTEMPLPKEQVEEVKLKMDGESGEVRLCPKCVAVGR